MRKFCTACNQEKSVNEFTICRGNKKDGRASSCKSCQAIYRTTENSKQAQDKFYHSPAKKRYAQSEVGKAAALRGTKKWQAANPIKIIAHGILNRAIAKGEVVREPCRVCDTTHNVWGHHEDYTKPLDVLWLCPTHHKALHRHQNEVMKQVMVLITASYFGGGQLAQF